MNVLESVIPIDSLPTWSDGVFSVFYHQFSGATYLMSPWAIKVLELVADGVRVPSELIDQLQSQAISCGQETNSAYFEALIQELVRLDYLVEKLVR